MSRLQQYISVEAIDYQKDSLLFKEMQLVVTDFLVADTEDKEAKDTLLLRMAGVIKAHTNLSFKINHEKETYASAWVFSPQMDRNNPVLTNYHRAAMDNSDSLKLLSKTKSILTGGVDLNTSKVSGVFTELTLRMHITRGLLPYGVGAVENSHYTPAEISAIILHEIGHIFTYFEFLGSTLTTNYVLQYASRNLMQSNDTVRKYKIVKEIEEVLEIKVKDPAALVASNSSEIINVVLLREVAIKRHEELGSNTYDLTAWEMLSDQFSARHGAGLALVTGLDKIYRASNNPAYMSSGEFFLSELMAAVGSLISIPVRIGLIPILILFIDNPDEQLYDQAKQRMLRIKQDMVGQLKDTKLNPTISTRLVKDIETVDLLLGDLKVHRNFMQAFWRTFNTKVRNQYNQTIFQQELETLANNDLFLKAAKLKQYS